MLKVEERNNNANAGTLILAPEVPAITITMNGNLNKIPQAPSEYQPKADLQVSTFLESDTKALGHQIAGHDRTGVLKHKKLGYVLKPLQKEPLGTREVEFYRKVYTDEEFLKPTHNHILQKYLPNYHGVVRIQRLDEASGNLVWKHYLALQDLVEEFSKPCLIDIKVGVQTWDPSAPPKKVAHEQSKYVGTKGPLGLSLTGMQFYDLLARKTVKMEKDYGKSLTESSFVESIRTFLNHGFGPGTGVPLAIVQRLIPRLEEIQKYFEVQRDFCYYSSSLLIGYDADVFLSQNQEEMSMSRDEDVGSWLRIYMIDFAHVIPMEGLDPGPDSNYLFGLRHLIKVFKLIEGTCSSSEGYKSSASGSDTE